MTERSHRTWRWIVAAWLVLVAVAGGVTLWLRDAAEPPGPYVWENATSPSPPPECTRPAPGQDGADVLCFVRTR
ncbi:hypothetical protein [Streptomyces sp. NPDC056628]|uniref:hypothetical protein n=1 Tax=Streptomyces sp. NPDC056628 TaxID=3345882 RepID=UPI00368EED27